MVLSATERRRAARERARERAQARKGTRVKVRMPDDFTVNGWCRANNYLVTEEEYPDPKLRTRERFRRASKVMRAYQQTDEYRHAFSVAQVENWEARVAAARRQSDTTEVLLLEKLIERNGGETTAELIACAINIIAGELSLRAREGVKSLDTKELVLISNTLTGLAKAASAVKKAEGWKPQVQVNNVTVNNSSKTGGVIGGLEDVVDLRKCDVTER